MADLKSSAKVHIVMFPWFAFGHMTPYLHLSNKLSERGHTISFLLPRGAQPNIEQLSLYPDLIHFFPLDVPHVDGLPSGAQTASDVPFPSHTYLATAFDKTRNQVKTILTTLIKPDFVFFDFGFWVPALARDLGIKSIYYAVVGAAGHAGALVPSFKIKKNWTPAELVQTPPGYPSPTVKLREHEAGQVLVLVQEMGSGLTLYERLTTSMKECDAIAIRTCREIEGPFCDYISQQYNKPVHLTGPVLPDDSTQQPPEKKVEDPWAKWLSKFKPKSVVYCALGSQIVLNKEQFQEMILGFELTQLPFLAALKPPQGCKTIEEALPDGFKERVLDEGRGLIYGGWVPQPAILGHPSVGCFVSHCGFGSMWESLLSDCQIVLVPLLGDQIINARLMVEELKVAVEVEQEKQENNNNDNGSGWFISKESLCKAIKSVMDEDSKIGWEVKSNHAKWKEIVSNKNMEKGYLDSLIQILQEMLD